jgi:perosamine synthetase
MSERSDERDAHHPPRWPVYSPDAQAACAALLARGRSFDYGHGPELRAFEDAFVDRLGRGYALAVNSGTSALFLAYAALGIGPGDEVVVADYTFLATATPLFWLGAVPLLADSDSVTGNVTANTIEAAISDRTRAVAVTHLFGHPCDMAPIVALCRQRGLALVEDCSHAHGSTRDGREVGTWGDVSVFSTGGLKMVSGGLGGVLVTDDERLHDLACLISSFQGRPQRDVRNADLRRLADVGLGGNLRMSPLAAVLALSHLRVLDDLGAAKAAACDQLIAELCQFPGIEPVRVCPGVDLGARYGVNVRYDENATGVSRDDLVAALQAEGLKVGGPRTEPLHRTSVFGGSAAAARDDVVRRTSGRTYANSAADFPGAEAVSRSWLGLPADYLYAPDAEMLGHYRDGFATVFKALL